MKRLALLALGLIVAGCNTSSTFFVKETLATLPSGDQVVTMAEMHSGGCRPNPTTTRVETTWNRTGQPDRVLTVHGDMTNLGPHRSQLETRSLDADHVILAGDDGKPLASFDYDHARAYFGPAAQPEWAHVPAASAGK